MEVSIKNKAFFLHNWKNTIYLVVFVNFNSPSCKIYRKYFDIWQGHDGKWMSFWYFVKAVMVTEIWYSAMTGWWIFWWSGMLRWWLRIWTYGDAQTIFHIDWNVFCSVLGSTKFNMAGVCIESGSEPGTRNSRICWSWSTDRQQF